jgi:hypothetical protein
LRRSIGRHPHKHSRPKIGNAKRERQKDWEKDGRFDRDSGNGVSGETPQEAFARGRASQETAKYANHLRSTITDREKE